MTRMLAIVRTAADAAIAVEGGADGIVVRAPQPAVPEGIAASVGGRCGVTLWWDASDAEAPGQDLPAALRSCGADTVWGDVDGTPPDVPRWAVLTRIEASDVAAAAARAHAGVVIAGRAGAGRLLAQVSIADLERQRRIAESCGLRFGIAGSMEAPDVPRLLALGPDCIVCDDLLRDAASPSGPIMPEKLRLARALIDACASVQERPVPAIVPHGPDRIFVRDWTVSLHLGAYAHEREAQRVRFSVEVEVARSVERAADMRDVVTYDLIVDAIARATVTHVALVETIAEDVARMILAHPRVSGVDVTVEKLDLGPGALGCRIQRRRAS